MKKYPNIFKSIKTIVVILLFLIGLNWDTIESHEKLQEILFHDHSLSWGSGIFFVLHVSGLLLIKTTITDKTINLDRLVYLLTIVFSILLLYMTVSLFFFQLQFQI